jgi:hypothetical protein
MVRPIKINKETKTYNLTIPIDDFMELSAYSELHTNRYNVQVSVADLIRSAVTLYLEDLRQEEEQRNVTV